MDMEVFVDSLTLAEMNKLSNIIYERRKKYARANMLPLIQAEIRLVEGGDYIQAIKYYRSRNNSSLLEAKVAIDAYRDNMIR